jgi:proteasome lid subunit RPN8/RPN11
MTAASATPRILERMLKCTRSFIFNDSHGEVRFVAGRSRVAADSPYAKAYPTYFTAIPGQAGGSRTRTLASHGSATMTAPPPPAATKGREAWRIVNSPECSFSHTPGSTRVRLSRGARDELLQVIDETSAAGETGGLLFGSSTSSLIEVMAVSGPGPGSDRGPGHYDSDLEHDLAIVAQRPADSGPIGIWHTHPQATRAPSDVDLRSMRAYRSQVFQLPRLLSVIAVPAGDSWDFEAFVTTPGHGKDTAARATIA